MKTEVELTEWLEKMCSKHIRPRLWEGTVRNPQWHDITVGRLMQRANCNLMMASRYLVGDDQQQGIKELVDAINYIMFIIDNVEEGRYAPE